MKRKQIADWIRNHKKQTVLLIVVLVLLVGGGVTALILKSSDSVTRTDNGAAAAEDQKPTTVASPLTGVQVTPASAKRPVTAIVIENSPDARPQSGLAKAGIVFEAIAEGGITRFMTLWQEGRNNPIGPVRSLRPYFIDWALAFDAPVAHVGGSALALKQAKQLNMKDLDQFYNAQAYWRSPDRYAPHNVYTNTQKLDTLMKQKGYTKSEFKPLLRKEPNPAAKARARIITIPISGPLYNVEYRYSKSTNTYKRWVGGEPQTDAQTKKQLAPDVVIAMEVVNRAKYNGRWDYELVGKGRVKIFQDGKVYTGLWKKPSKYSMIRFTKKSGQKIALNPGQTWITAVDVGSPVRFRP